MKERRRSLPELIVGVSHLMRLQLGHQNLYYANEYDEINLIQKERKREVKIMSHVMCVIQTTPISQFYYRT